MVSVAVDRDKNSIHGGTTAPGFVIKKKIFSCRSRKTPEPWPHPYTAAPHPCETGQPQTSLLQKAFVATPLFFLGAAHSKTVSKNGSQNEPHLQMYF
jgi:hypothetical protein